jgi:hypothetical protein
MPQKRPAKRRTQPPPTDDFKSVARRLECDEDKERFEAKLGKLVRAKKPITKKKV